MGFRYYRRVNLGKGWGLNLSKSGISSSLRTKYGSIGTKMYSIRTGIQGLSYRGSTGKKSGIIGLILLLLFGVFIITWYIFKLIISIVAFLLASVFKEEGISYKNLVLILSGALVILIYIYFSIQHSSTKNVQTIVPIYIDKGKIKTSIGLKLPITNNNDEKKTLITDSQSATKDTLRAPIPQHSLQNINLTDSGQSKFRIGFDYSDSSNSSTFSDTIMSIMAKTKPRF